MAEVPRFHLNATGDFFVEDGMCIACTAPEHEAPELMANATDSSGHYHCYFRRQPANAAEVEHAIRAVFVSCCGAVTYGGTDPSILLRLEELKERGWSRRDA